jgi:hypothetical protein
MTRPVTLSEAAERIAQGAPRDVALAEFLDSFYIEASAEARLTMLAGEPPLSGDARLDALLGAIGEYLAKQHRLARVPPWVGDPRRVLVEPWFTGADDSDGMREYLAVSSPAEFIHHNIFTEPTPLRRARRGVEP